jgi:transcriptional regulator with XRE-family HTH domain
MPATPKRAGRTPKPGSQFPSQVLTSNLRILRAIRGFSQEEVAETLRRLGHDWTQTTVSQVELGARHVNVDELFALALTLSVYPGDLLSPVMSPRLKAEFGIIKIDKPAEAVAVDVGTAKPLPARFVDDWLRGQSGDTKLVVHRDGELHVLTGRFLLVGYEEPEPSEEPQP